nr:hypothetical protein [Tanacetum cinerariifolium]
NMANENVPTLAPTRSDDHILPFAASVGYPREIHFVSRMAVNNLYQTCRAILSMINQCLTGMNFSPTKKGKKTKRHVILAEKEGGKKKMAPKADIPIKPAPAKQAKPATAKEPKPKPVKEKSTKPTPLQKADMGVCEENDLERAIQTSLESFQVLGQAHFGGVVIREPVVEATRPLFVVEGKGKAIAMKEQATQSLLALHTPKIRNAKTGVDTDKVISEGDTEILNIDHGKNLESRPPPDDDKMDEYQARSDPGKSHVALAGSNPEPMYDDFMATIYPKVHESLIFLADEQVILDDLLSSSRTLSSMKILDNIYTFGDKFFNDKSTKDEPRK